MSSTWSRARIWIPVKGGVEAAPYSIDDNLWGRSSEGKWIEDLSHAPEDDVFDLVTRPDLDPGQGRRRGGAVFDRRQPVGALVRGQVDRGPEPRAGGRCLRPGHAPGAGSRSRAASRRRRIRSTTTCGGARPRASGSRT